MDYCTLHQLHNVFQPDQVGMYSANKKEVILATYSHAAVEAFTNLQLQIDYSDKFIFSDDKVNG